MSIRDQVRAVVDGILAGDILGTFDLTPKGGERVQQRQVAVQEWRDGKIVGETFYHG